MADKDMTNRQMFEALKRELQRFVTKEDLKNELKNFATKDDLAAVKIDLGSVKSDLEKAIARLERKLDGYQKVNIQHHLAVRGEAGDLNRKFGELREGLAHAAGMV